MSQSTRRAGVTLAGLSGGQARDFILGNPILSRYFGWMVDGVASGLNLARVRAWNASMRAEANDERRQCWESGNFVGMTGKCVEDPEVGVEKTLKQLSGQSQFEISDLRRVRLEAYLAKEFYGEWKGAAESGDTSKMGEILDKYGQYPEVMSTNPYIGGMSFSGFNPEQVINGAILGDGPIAGKVEICTTPGQTNCVDPTNVQDIWEDFGRHVQVIFKGLQIPGLPEWMPFPAVLELPTLGDIWNKVSSPFEEEYNRQLEECLDGGGSPAECEEQINAAGILTGVITQGASDIADATGEKVGEIIDKGLEGIDCVLNPEECAGKIKDILGGVFEGEGDIWGTVDPTASGIPDWLKVIIIGGQYGDEVLGALEGLLGNDIDGNGTIGIPITGTCEEGEADFGNGCEPVCPENPSIPASSEQCVPAFQDDGPTAQECAQQNRQHIPGDASTQTASSCGECLNGFEEVLDQCQEKEDIFENQGPSAQECAEQNRDFNEATDVEDSSCGPCLSGFREENGVCVEGAEEQQCENGASNFPDCDMCPDGETSPDQHSGGNCGGSLIDSNDPYGCKAGRPEGAYTFGTQTWDRACSGDYCTDGTRKETIDGVYGANCPDYVAPEAGTDGEDGTGDGICDQQNRETNEDGSCGGCKAGYKLDETDQGCVEDPDYVGPEGGEEGEESSGGGVGGVGGGYSSPGPDLAFTIAGEPQTLQRQRFGGTQQTPDTLESLFAGQKRSKELQDFPILAFLQKGRIV